MQYAKQVVALILSSSEELHRVFHLQSLSYSSLLKLSWSSPPQGSVTVNSDACYMSSYDIMGFGCAIRDWKGTWKKGCADVCCETDCHEAFILLKNDTSAANNDVTELTRRIHALMKRSWRVELALIQRTANHVADALAKYAVVQNIDQVEWLIPNNNVKELLKYDFLN
ncbi:hypothetical protein PIB30_098310 [Stylosanthes scabra]|uniref:RNase H type-1 domain-containing protein n=1 Tax=Stylosanthes scabra TaxID=79078 RepID=A0ABU6ZVB3_9FABA|nr:hypothetical protein [Stylosanthes scabra]